MPCAALAIFAAAAYGQAGDLVFVDGFEGSGEPAELAGITDAHNAVRAGVATSPPLAPLAWSASLADTARSWAAQCRDTQAPIGMIDHNPGRSTGHPWYVGENIYAASWPAPPQSAVTSWASEVAFYDYARNSCAAGQVCGHYTQLVWRTTAFVGCARSYCPGLAYAHSVVCNYGPGGNTGGRPY